MDKNEIAALLEALCDRPFAGDADGRSPAMTDIAHGTAPGLSGAPGHERATADAAALASILSGTATAAECDGFQEAAMTSGAVRLDAQSALAFVEGIEQAPSEAPAHLVDEALASARGGRRSLAASEPRPSVWSRIAGVRIGARRGGMVAAGAVLIMAGGVSWSLLLRPAAPPEDRVAVPSATNPDDAPSITPEAAKPAPEPAPMSPMSAPIPGGGSAATTAPISTPVPAQTAPEGAPAQARADPCEPRDAAGVEAQAARAADAAKRGANRPQGKTAAAAVADPGCPDAAGNTGAAEAGSNPKADQAPARATRPGSQVGGLDRHPPAAALRSAPPAVSPAAPAKPARPNQPPR